MIEMTNVKSSDRVLSVDILRGFNMFWLVGGTGVGLGVVRLCGGRVCEILEPQLDHAKWVGFTFYDFIFPLFVFVVGMSVVFSVTKVLEREGRMAAYRRIAQRTLLLFLLGVIYYGGMNVPLSEVRWLGVLQRLGLCYGITAILFCHLNVRGLVAVCIAILIAYWALLCFVPVPGATAVSWEVGENWPAYIDAHFLPGKKHEGTWDGNGLLSTLPAVSNCILGACAAMLLRVKSLTEQAKAIHCMTIGVVLILAGLLWSLHVPIIKLIWTPSYVLLSGGLSFLLLGVIHQVVDVWQMRRGTAPFLWIGANALTIYLARNFLDFNKLALRFVGGDIANLLGTDLAYLLTTLVSLALSLILVRYLYKNKIFLRV